REPKQLEFLHEASGRWLAADMHPAPDGMLVHFRDVTSRRSQECETRRLASDLQERVKELGLLHKAAGLLVAEDSEPGDLLREIAALLPPARRFPDHAVAEVVFKGISATTGAMPPDTGRAIVSRFQTDSGDEGHVRVAYREDES